MRNVNPLYVSGIAVSAALVAAVSSIALEVHPVPLGIFILSLIVGTLLDRRQNAEPFIKPIYLIIAVVAGIVISIRGISEENLFYRALGILLIIISAKLISPKKSRDMMQLFLLNFFVIAGSAVTRLDIEFALLIVGETFLSILGLVLIYGSSEQQEIPLSQIWRLVRWSGLITIFLIPLTAIIFLVIPRPTRTLFAWGGGTAAKSGFSDRVTPGAVEQIKMDRSPAFRVKWIGGERTKSIYWRGMVYDSYSDGAWERRTGERVTVPFMKDNTVEYEVILEPKDSRYLPVMGIPFDITGVRLRTYFVSGYTVESSRSLNERTIYRVKSYNVSDIPPDKSPDLYLAVPDELYPDITSIAESLKRKKAYETAYEIEKFLKQGFSYDLSPGLPEGDPVLYFLNYSKKGHCEYFASSMVLMLRSAGIPARMVGGYLEGEWNGIGQYYLVRQSDAHTWVEAWIEGRGWVTFDPTPSATQSASGSGSSRVIRVIDFLRLKWYYWVLDYTVNRQIDLVKKTASFLRAFQSGHRSINIKENLPDIRYLIASAFMAVVIISIFLIRRFVQSMPGSWGGKFVRLMRRYGLDINKGETVMEFGLRISDEYPSAKTSILNFTNSYYSFEYGENGDGRELAKYLEDVEMNLKRKPLLL